MEHASPSPSPSPSVVSTGIRGLDHVLRGGLPARRVYLVEGVPGSGKTTLALQFLLEGVRRGEPVLYVTLSESLEELQAVALSHGWDLSGVHVHEMSGGEEVLRGDDYTLFHPSEVELGEATQDILTEVERLRPTRVVFDSLSELRLLAGSPLRYRRQILGLKRYFSGRNSTVLLLDDLTSHERDLQVQSISHGVLLLEQHHPEYGAERRRLRVVKVRGVPFRGGYHDYAIRRGGIEVFPRLVAAEHRQAGSRQQLSSGIVEFDALLGGGIEHGTSTLIVGPPGTGKSSLAAQFVARAAARGCRAAMFLFDESINTLLVRAHALGMDLRPHIDAGTVKVQQVDPAELSPGEFAHAIRRAVEEDGARVVVIDSLNGYLNAMPGEDFLTIQLHEMLAYLAQCDVATLLIAANQGLIGSQMTSPVDASYLADGVILLRFFESSGAVRQAISVIKKRNSVHERSIRELRMSDGRISVGAPLHEFRGILSGTPEFSGSADQLLDKRDP